jgi:GNAT superfamily N-acetyltransferase
VRFLASNGVTGREEATGFLALALAHDSTLRCWVVERGHDIVGTMCVVARVGLKKPHWLIESIAIDAAHEGQGLTRLLLKEVRAEARLHKVRSLATQCSPRGRGDGDCLLKGRLY